MSFEDWKTVAAFGGLALGLINLLIGIYKDFWRKGRLLVRIEDASAKCTEEGVYDIRITTVVTARVTDIYLTSITVRHSEPVFGPYETRSAVVVNRVYPYTSAEMLDLSGEDFRAEIERLNGKACAVRDLKINKDAQATILIGDRFEGVRLPDGYDEWPQDGWFLDVHYGHKSISIPFMWNIHPKSTTGSFRRTQRAASL